MVFATKTTVHKRTAQNHHQQPTSAPIDAESLYTNAAFLPPRAFGPVKLASIPGAGRGLVLTAPVAPGALLVVSEPAGQVLRAAEGQTLKPSQLLPVLQADGALSDEDRRRLALLVSGAASPRRPPLVSVPEFIGQGADSRPGGKQKQSSPKKGFGAPAAAAAALEPPTELTATELHEVLRLNAWGQEYADVGAAALRGDASHSYIGVWPELALINHSCVPNTLTIMVGDRMLCRAARALPAGKELTISYLGFEGTAPVSERQRQLQEMYDFTCKCPRCEVEAAQPEAITSLLDDMWGWLEQGLPERVRDLVLQGNMPALSVVQQQLEQHVGRLEGLMEGHGVPPEVRTFLRASAYGCFELLAVIKSEQLVRARAQATTSAHLPPPPATAAAASPVPGTAGGELVSAAGWQGGGAGDAAPHPGAEDQDQEQEQQDEQEDDAKLPAGLVALMQVISPGSDSHLFLTLEWLSRAGARHPRESPVVAEAAQACLAAHLTRYGKVSDALLTRLMTERSKTVFELGRVLLPTRQAAQPAPTTAAGAPWPAASPMVKVVAPVGLRLPQAAKAMSS